MVLIQRPGRTRKWPITLDAKRQTVESADVCFWQKTKERKLTYTDLTKICSFYFRKDFECRYCGCPLNEDVTCRILAGNKPNAV